MRSLVRVAAALALAACSHDRAEPPLAPTPPAPDAGAPARIDLPVPDQWQLQSSKAVTDPDATIAATGYAARGWHKAPVPGTVVGALVADGTHPDPYVGMNLRALPGGTDYDIGQVFYEKPMSPNNPFRAPWWYRTELTVPPLAPGRRLWLRLDGLNYRAAVWLNGRQLADDRQVVGAYRSFLFDVTAQVAAGANAVALKVTTSDLEDLGINWVDWAPFPPDKNLGLWRPVALYSTGPVALEPPHVVTDLDLPALDHARLTVVVELRNASDRAVTARVEGSIAVAAAPGADAGLPPPPILFADTVALAAGERKTIRLGPDRYPQLAITRPRLWWPFELGAQNLYAATVRVVVDGAASDEQTARFGIREVSTELTSEGHRVFRVNGHRVLIRGAGWTPDLLLRPDTQRVDDQLDYVKDMRLNTIRIEGKLGDDHLLDRADEDGILIMAGWCCCDRWESPEDWSAENRAVARGSLEDQARLLRRHPSLLVWLNGSDDIVTPDVERMYVDLLRGLDWPTPTIGSASARTSTVTGPTGVKMTGPYGWVPPVYWTQDTARGGAFGFNTETSMGPAIPPVRSLRRMLGADHLWPIDQTWRFHAGGSDNTQDLSAYTSGLDARYGKATSVEDFAWKSQLAAYEGVRAMFEAFAGRKYHATGVVQWMLNDPWPGLIWHLYDYYLVPGGGYFGAKKACEPLHVQYMPDDRSIVVVNSTARAAAGLAVRAEAVDLDGTVRWSDEATVDVAEDGTARALTVPESIAGLGTTYLLHLRLGPAEESRSENVYWLSRVPDVLDWARANWYLTPTKSYGDLTGLARMPPAQIKIAATTASLPGGEVEVRVTLDHVGGAPAFFLRAEILRGDGDEIVPVLWSDNDVTLFAGQHRALVAHLRRGGSSISSLRVSGGNASASLTLRAP